LTNLREARLPDALSALRQSSPWKANEHRPKYRRYILQNFGAVMGASKLAAAGPRNPLCTLLFLRSLVQKFLIANATRPAISCGDGGFALRNDTKPAKPWSLS
jgi:hypothetical protein